MNHTNLYPHWASTPLIIQLPYNSPYDWEGILSYFRKRMLINIEQIDAHRYWRTVQLGGYIGWFSVHHAPEQKALIATLAPSLGPILPLIVARIEHQFDLHAQPSLMQAHLATHPHFSDAVAQRPGIRLPGAFDGFEMAVRAILGQQISIQAATALAAKFVHAFGPSIETTPGQIHYFFPSTYRIALLSQADITVLGISSVRARGIIALAQAAVSGQLLIEPTHEIEKTIAQLIELPSIGAWTAHYIAMRALRWKDAFPKEDIIVRNNLGGLTAREAEQLSQQWRPWRSYATLYIWQKLISLE